MPLEETEGSVAAPQRRHPRILRAVAWLRRHPVLSGTTGILGVAVVFLLDMSVPGFVMIGLYVVPVFFLALAVDERAVAFVVALCLGLAAFALFWDVQLGWNEVLMLLYGAIIGSAMVALSYLVKRLSAISEYAILRAQLSEAGADILGSARSRDDLDELLEYALERLGEQLDATNGVLLLLDDGQWTGRAGFGLGLDARDVVAEYAEMPLAAQAIRADVPVMRDFSAADPAPLAPLAAYIQPERVLLLPMRALEREVGVMIFNRSKDSGDYSADQISLAEGLARYVAVTVDNVRLMYEINTRRRDLELVRDSSLDFAQSINMSEVLEAVVTRLVRTLDMHACDIYEVDVDAGVIRNLTTYDDGVFGAADWTGKEFPIDHFASSALAILSRRPVVITSLDDPRLNDTEREYMQRLGHMTRLLIPMRIRDDVMALVELFDDRAGRDFSDDEVELARAICRFAALAIDKARLYEQQRVTAARRDRLARRLQRLQSFAVELNQRLDRAELQDVLDEVTKAALDLLHVRAAAVMAGAGEYLAVRALAVSGSAPPSALVAAEADLLERCAHAVTVPADDGYAGTDVVGAAVGEYDGLLVAALEGEAAQQISMLVVADKQQGDFDEEDRLLIATLAAQLSASMHNALAYQREHVIAETFQKALLMEPPVVPGIEVGVCYRAATDSARVGGDFYDLVTLGPGRLLVIVGDVCGKSLSAAAQSAVVRYMLRAFAAEGSPGEALSRLNAAVNAQTPNQPFVTLVVGYIDVARHMFEYAVAGHPRPIVLAGQAGFPMPGEGNVPIGIFRGATYPTNRAVLPDDSCIVLYTDGITESRRDGVLFGEDRLNEAVRANLPLSAQALSDTLLETVKEYAGGVLPDDCAVVTIKLP